MGRIEGFYGSTSLVGAENAVEFSSKLRIFVDLTAGGGARARAQLPGPYRDGSKNKTSRLTAAALTRAHRSNKGHRANLG